MHTRVEMNKNNRHRAWEQALILGLLATGMTACGEKEQKEELKVSYESIAGNQEITGSYDLPQILESGELIAVTLSGPDTYYEYREKPTGLQYELAERFATQIGASLRIEVVKDTAELVKRIVDNDADLIAVELDVTPFGKVLQACGSYSQNGKEKKKSWAVSKGATELAEALDKWYRPELKKAVQTEESRKFLPQFLVRRRPRAPFLSRSQGIISPYDVHFKRHASAINWDWRLMAAQCYQESAFDPNAVSWAGARGLMQIMPSTAQHLNLPMEQIYQPEKNIQAAAKYLRELEYKFSDINPREERLWFVLASYNGGAGHIQDARTLARNAGRNANRWDEVKHFVLNLSDPRFYNSREVKYGYMRGSETYQYVESIRSRWTEYRRVAKPERMPTKAKGERKKKFR